MHELFWSHNSEYFSILDSYFEQIREYQKSFIDPCSARSENQAQNFLRLAVDVYFVSVTFSVRKTHAQTNKNQQACQRQQPTPPANKSNKSAKTAVKSKKKKRKK